MVALDNLRGLFQPVILWFFDSAIPSIYPKAIYIFLERYDFSIGKHV